MIEFYNIEITGRFSYLWLKYVTGYNLNVHCARSLKGEYSQQIKPDLKAASWITLDEFPARILYLCGVAKPYNWEKNFHLAMIAAEGSNIEVDNNGIRMLVKGAVPVPLDVCRLTMEQVNHPKISVKSYATCRNWQFANHLHAYQLLNNEQ